MQKNVTKCQQMTIEKLGNRILVLEAEQREEAKAEQGHTLEKAQLNRKVAALENQLRFQTNLNDETKKEIEKLDGEISQVADSCNSRETILQRKLEDVLEQLRGERVQNAALKSDMMQRENHIEQLKTSLKQQTADTKLAKLENQAVIKQCEYEKNSIGQQLKHIKADLLKDGVKSPRLGEPPVTLQRPQARVDVSTDSYLDMSYTQSPSLILRNQRQASVERQYLRENNVDNGGTFNIK